MNSLKLTRRWLVWAAVAVLGFGLLASPVEAGVLTKPFVWLAERFGKSATKSVAKNGVKSVAKTATEKELRYVVRKYGAEVGAKLEGIAQRTGIPKERLVTELRQFGSTYRRAGFSEEALRFGIQHGADGRFFVNRPDLFLALKKSGCLENGTEGVIRESRYLVRGTGGSWSALRRELTQAGMNNGTSRDFCEELFTCRVRAGQLRDASGTPLFPKGTELFSGHLPSSPGQMADIRQGFDFLHPKPNEPLRIIEFGTGKKPNNLTEISGERLRNQLHEFVVRSQNKDQLRAAGFPQELLNPSNLKDPEFPIHEFVNFELYAPEIDPALLAKAAGQSKAVVKAFQLP